MLDAISHDDDPAGWKVLCVSAEKDVLILKDVERDNFDFYLSVSRGGEEFLLIELLRSAHHVMLDVAYEDCAEIMIKWLQGGLV